MSFVFRHNLFLGSDHIKRFFDSSPYKDQRYLFIKNLPTPTKQKKEESHMCNIPQYNTFFSDKSFNPLRSIPRSSHMSHISVTDLERYFSCISEVFRRQKKEQIAFCYMGAVKLLKVLTLVYKERENSGILASCYVNNMREGDISIMHLFSAQYSVDTSVNIIRNLIKMAYNLYVVPCKTVNTIKILANIVGHGSGYKRGKSMIASALNERNIEYVAYHKNKPPCRPENHTQTRKIISEALDAIRKGPARNIVLQTSDFVYIIVNRDKQDNISVPKIIFTCSADNAKRPIIDEVK